MEVGRLNKIYSETLAFDYFQLCAHILLLTSFVLKHSGKKVKLSGHHDEVNVVQVQD